MRIVLILAALVCNLMAGTALADGIDGRLGVTGKAGALVPLQSDFVSGTTGSRTGLAAGGGLIFGLCRNLAAEIDVSHVSSLNVELAGSKAYEATLTDVALGMQYRIASDNRLVPYLGAGVDFIKGDLTHVASGARYSMDWTEGAHVNAGLDYFVTKGIALTADLRGVFAFAGDVKSAGVKVGEYHPASFIGTLGIRLFLPEGLFD